MAYKIMVIDDEQMILDMLRDQFELEQYQVITARSAAEAIDKLNTQPNLIMLDINMPGMDGLQLCQKIRDDVSCPILFLTARLEEADRVAGLRAGGDDYIMKPFSLAELMARLDAHLRREERVQRQITTRFFGNLAIDYAARTLRIKEQPVELARIEFDIVELLSLHPGQVFSRETIYEQVRGIDGMADNAVIKEHIRRIRNKLGEACIETVWGCGYKWAV
nr:response regulator transcription factor [uncultured Acetatifactor sp.]